MSILTQAPYEEELPVLMNATSRETVRRFLETLLPTNGAVGIRSSINTEEGAIPILLYPSHATIMTERIQKEISLMDLRSCLDSMLISEAQRVEPLALPPGCISLARSGNTMELNCYYPGREASIKYQPGASALTVLEVPLPNIVIYHALTKGGDGFWTITDTRYLCTPIPFASFPSDTIFNSPDSSKGVYKLPFSNVYSDCRLCYGHNTMPGKVTDNLRPLDYFYQILTISPFNNDLGIVGISKQYHPKDWYEYLASLTEFPYDLLQ